MEEDRLSRAIGRIERALARIETQTALAASRPRHEHGPDHALAARHEALRASVATSLTELDTLIERLES